MCRFFYLVKQNESFECVWFGVFMCAFLNFDVGFKFLSLSDLA